jgi:hypothetical protein
MRKKKVLSPPELETEKILKAELPEYDIRANHRLADVIHMTEEQFKYMGGYHLDFAICDKHANIIAAVELDGESRPTFVRSCNQIHRPPNNNFRNSRIIDVDTQQHCSKDVQQHWKKYSYTNSSSRKPAHATGNKTSRGTTKSECATAKI